MIVLKGHLLLEEQIDELLGALLENSRALEPANLRFHQKVCVLRAVSSARTGYQRYWIAIEKLNSMRNQLAHRLEPSKLEALTRDFFRSLEGPVMPESYYKKKSTDKRLRDHLAFLCGWLAGLSRGIATVRAIANKRTQPTR